MIVETFAGIVIVNIIFFIKFSFFSKGRDMAGQRLSSALSLVNLGGAGQGVRDSRWVDLKYDCSFIFPHNILKVTIITITLKEVISGAGQYCTLQLVTANLRPSEGFLTRLVGDTYTCYFTRC